MIKIWWWFFIFYLPGKHAEESVDDLARESNSHLYPQSLKQYQEESQHLIRHIYKGKGIVESRLKHTYYYTAA